MEGGGRMTHVGRLNRKKQKQTRLSDVSRSWRGGLTERVRNRDKGNEYVEEEIKMKKGGMSCVCRASLGGEIVH